MWNSSQQDVRMRIFNLLFLFFFGGGGTSTVNDVKIERDTLLNCVFDVCSLKSQPITKILCVLFQNPYLYRHSEWSTNVVCWTNGFIVLLWDIFSYFGQINKLTENKTLIHTRTDKLTEHKTKINRQTDKTRQR